MQRVVQGVLREEGDLELAGLIVSAECCAIAVEFYDVYPCVASRSLVRREFTGSGSPWLSLHEGQLKVCPGVMDHAPLGPEDVYSTPVEGEGCGRTHLVREGEVPVRVPA